VSRATTIRKVRVLRTELAESKAREEATHSLDHAIRGGSNTTHSSWSQVQRYLFPEVLLRLDRTQTNLLYATLTEGEVPVVLKTDLESVDEWLRAEGTPIPKDELSAAIRLLESTVSRSLAGNDLSKTQSALQQVKRALKVG